MVVEVIGCSMKRLYLVFKPTFLRTSKCRRIVKLCGKAEGHVRTFETILKTNVIQVPLKRR